METIIYYIKSIVGVTDLKGDDEIQLQRDIEEYVNSSKYADSNSNTKELERLMAAASLAESIEPSKEEDIEVKESEPKKVDPEEARKSELADKKGTYKQKFYDNLDKHLELLDKIEKDNDAIIPGQPFFKPPAFSPDGKAYFRMPPFSVPRSVYQAVKVGKMNLLTKETLPTMENFVSFFQNLLWIEEAHQAIEMHRYDMSDVLLGKFDSDFLILPVPGLAEGRPSLMRGDKLIVESEKRSSRYEGYIFDVREEDVLIKLHESLHRISLDGLRFNVSFQASRTPYRRCHYGIRQISSNPLCRKIVFPKKVPTDKLDGPIVADAFFTQNFKWLNNQLNRFQRNAVINILKARCRPRPYMVFGPPGTGKTVTLVEAILQVYTIHKDAKILVCANSNSSTDILAERIYKSGIVAKDEMVRVSAFYRMGKLIPKEVEQITKDADMISGEEYSKYRIVVTTCIQSGVLYYFYDRFDYLFLDEAGHANEPESMLPISLLSRDSCNVIIMAGDHKQLGPIVVSPLAKEFGLGLSMFERLCALPVYQKTPNKDELLAYDENYLTKLITSYRSDERIMSVSNELFYDNELKCKNKTPKSLLDLLRIPSPLIFHAIHGRDRREYLNPSWFNASEAITCMTYTRRLYDAGLKPDQIGIITPYRRQIEKLKLLFEKCYMRACKIGTMEEFQGDERDVILISSVRTQEKHLDHDQKFQLGFLFDPKRFNVAVTRAKNLVIVIGDPNILGRDDCWKKYMEKAHHVVERKEELQTVE